MIGSLLFLCLLIDSVFLSILYRVNLSEYEDFGMFISGKNTDFGATWYSEIGYLLIINLLVLSVRPILTIIYQVLRLRMFRYKVLTHTYKNHTNNTEDNIKFLELSAGPEYKFNLKFATLNTVIFATLCFGNAFPILYIIVFFALIIQYLTERYSLAMFYRLPPKFTTDLPV
jgi:hypothetical protein